MAERTDEMLRLTNGTVDLELALAFGPRILRYGFTGDPNVFASTPALSTDTIWGPWRPMGGHRLWVAPERMPGSYAPDDRAVEWHVNGAREAELRAPIDPAGIQKTMRVAIDPEGTRVRVVHVIANHTCWPIRVAPWAISIVDSAGTAFLPQPLFQSHAENFLPARRIVQWAYTDLADPRWRIGSRLIALTPDSDRADAQKIGIANAAGWCAVVLEHCTFIKSVEWIPDAEYPDLGCTHEIFTAGAYLEVETLAPLQVVEPGATATHTEIWRLGKGLDRQLEDRALERHIVELLSGPLGITA